MSIQEIFSPEPLKPRLFQQVIFETSDEAGADVGFFFQIAGGGTIGLPEMAYQRRDGGPGCGKIGCDFFRRHSEVLELGINSFQYAGNVDI